MILNEREYEVTKGWIASFQEPVDLLENDPAQREAVHPLLHNARLDASRSQLEELRTEAAAYEARRCATAPPTE